MAYSAPLVPSLRAPLSSEVIREQFGLISSTLGQMPTTLGTGSQGFTGGQWNSATLLDPTISLGRIGNTTQPCTVVSGYIVFNPSSYTSLGLTNVGLVRNTNGRLNLYHDATIKSFWDDSHNFVMGSGGYESAVTATGGFLYLPTVNGTASGAPTSYTGAVATVVDRAAKRIGLYISGSWAWTPALSATALSGSAVYDPASLADGAGVTTTITVTGAALGNYAKASFSLDLQGVMLFAWVSAANTVSVRFQNETAGVLDLGSGTISVAVSG